MLRPNLKIHRITDITVDLLIEKNIKGLILDIDNTLSTHHGDILIDGLESWLSCINDSGIKLIIASNSKEKRVKPFAERLGLSFISLSLKPLPFGYVKARKKMGLLKKEVAIVGDQMFTDTLGGNFYGITTIMTDLILPENKLSFKIRRKLERIILKKMKVENGYGC